MKFLIFNVMVAVALYSMVRSDSGPGELQDVVEQIATVAAPVIGAGAGMVEDAAEDFAARNDAPVAIAASTEPTVAIASPVPPAAPPAPLPPLGPPVVVAVVPVVPPELPVAAEVVPAPAPVKDPGPAIAAIDDPQVLARRAEVLGGQATPGIHTDEVAVADQPKFMTPAQRQQELFLLAREMELVFVQNAGL
jgi:hypothetical protein